MIFLAAVLIAVFVHTNIGANALPDLNKRHAMLRLEDVGPGGSYATPEGLGKLRAVFDYLQERGVPFHVAVIPRWKKLLPDGAWYEKGIDDPNPDDIVLKFVRLLQDAQRHGAVLGMHGYTHQFGTAKRDDNNQDTGIGFEFHVKGAPETATAAYAADRIGKSLAAFEKAGLQPGFWESPHYRDTREQEEVFRSFIGILYQPDFRSLRSFKDLNVYENENGFGHATAGSVYVPAPLRYFQNKESVEAVLAKLPSYDGLASLYYHPFLEFPFLEPVKDAEGKPVLRDGLPVYQYKPGVESNLQRLVNGVERQGFRWLSIHEVVPFSPAHRVNLPAGVKSSDLLLGDVRGVGHADVVFRRDDRVEVIEGVYRWPRNRGQEQPRTWLKQKFAPEAKLLLADINGDGKLDLVSCNRITGEIAVFYSGGGAFAPAVTFGVVQGGMDVVQALDVDGDGKADLVGRKQNELFVAVNQGERLEPRNMRLSVPSDAALLTGDLNGDGYDDILCFSRNEKKIYIFPNTGKGEFAAPISFDLSQDVKRLQVLASDTNGDGKADLILCDPADGLWDVLQGNADFQFSRVANTFGPWARGDRTGFAADFDGNRKGDIASYDETRHVLDLALSFRAR